MYIALNHLIKFNCTILYIIAHQNVIIITMRHSLALEHSIIYYEVP